MIHFSLKAGGATWFIDEIGPVQSAEGQPPLTEYSVGQWGEEYCVVRRNMILEQNADEATVRAKIKRDYLDGEYRAWKNYKPKYTFLKPAFIQ